MSTTPTTTPTSAIAEIPLGPQYAYEWNEAERTMRYCGYDEDYPETWVPNRQRLLDREHLKLVILAAEDRGFMVIVG